MSQDPTRDVTERLDRLILDWQYGQIVRAFVTLGIPDMFGGEERTVEWLAEASATHLPSLRRLLTAARALDLVRNGDVVNFRFNV